MFEQFTAAGSGTAFLDRFNKAGIIFKHAVHGDVVELSFLFW
jgi:hypothetical protein